MSLAISFLLYLFARVMTFGLECMAFVHTIIDQVRYGGDRRRLRDALFNGAYALDVYGNVTYGSLLNAYFLQKHGYHFGNPDESVSSALGKNWTMGRLTMLGEGCAGLLNLLDKDHCFKSIKGTWTLPKPESAVKWWKTVLFALVLLLVFSFFLGAAIWVAFITARAGYSKIFPK